MHVKRKKEETKNEDNTCFPSNGGSGVWEPLSNLLFTNLLKKECLSILAERGKKGLKTTWERRRMKEGDGRWIVGALDGSKIDVSAAPPYFFLRPAKNQQVNKLRIWWYAQKSNKSFKVSILRKIGKFTQYRYQKIKHGTS